ncbi:MAG: VWA domain-containing protein [Amaricoccus sp.]
MTVAAWTLARAAIDLLAVDPGLGGIRLRARAGPVRDRFTGALSGAMAPRACCRLGPSTPDEVLFGGLDLAATLASGTAVRTRGLLGEPAAVLVLPMAERAAPGFAARMVRLIEAGHSLVALDEGAEPDETLPEALADRLAAHLDLDGLTLAESNGAGADGPRIAAARAGLGAVAADGASLAALTTLAARLGTCSLRAPGLALRVARAAAALAGRAAIEEDDLRTAAALVLGPRARVLPEDACEPRAPSRRRRRRASPAPRGRAAARSAARRGADDAAPGLLDQLAGKATAGAGSGSGGARRGNRRGRPLPARRGKPAAGRVDIAATLRAAAPWQAARRAALARPRACVIVRMEDVRLRRFEERSDRLLIFAVDASGSAAHARLAEAKGAVEILLSEAYVRRDHAALVAFRGQDAQLLLPPTRSLVQVRRRLAALPGGGATPLAHGLRAALRLAEAARGRGMSPGLAVLTDGRANIALDGRPGRVAAGEDATVVARALRARQVPAVMIDLGLRAEPQLRELARSMGAACIALPRADARGISGAVGVALGACA